MSWFHDVMECITLMGLMGAKQCNGLFKNINYMHEYKLQTREGDFVRNGRGIGCHVRKFHGKFFGLEGLDWIVRI